ncbi:MAG: alpha/beta hydrolase [Acidobacteriota bacterium]
MAEPNFERLLIGEFSWKRLIRSMLLIPLLVYVGLLLLAWFYSDSIIFQPPKPGYQDSPEILKLQTRNGTRIAAIFLAHEKAEYTVLYSHGNAEDLGGMRPILEAIRRLGVNVCAYDYPGYGLSDGVASEASTYEAIDAVYDYLINEKQIPASRLISYGHSVGCGVAIDLASRREVAALIAESAFTTAFRVLTRIPLLPFDKFRNLGKLARVQCPVLLVHGKADDIIAFSHSEKLFAAANEPRRLILIDQAGHNDIVIFALNRYPAALRELGINLNHD